MIPPVTPPPLCDAPARPPPSSKVSRAPHPIRGAPLFSREGGSPDWIPAFAGKQLDVRCQDAAHHPTTTPAKAGAGLGDDGNAGQHVVTTTSPPGPRPPPGRCDRCDLHDAICRYSTGRPQGDGTTPAKAGAQLGDGGNAGQRIVTTTFSSGPWPPPGRCKGCGLHDAICRYSTGRPQRRWHHPGEGRGPVGGRWQRRTARHHSDLPTWAPAFAGVVIWGGRFRSWYRGQRKRPPHQPRHPHPAPPPRQMQPQILPAPRRHAIAQA